MISRYSLNILLATCLSAFLYLLVSAVSFDDGQQRVDLIIPKINMSWLAFEEGTIAENIKALKNGTHNPYRDFNHFVNGLFFNLSGCSFITTYAYASLGPHAGYYLSTYLRDLILGTGVYWITAGIWHFFSYHVYREKLFTSKGRPLPTWSTIIDQMKLAQASLFVYAGLPILSEYLIENNLTLTYFYIDQIGGWPMYFFFLAIYIALVEIGIYWMHRTLHENKFLFKYVHGLHHKYNKPETLTPWASIAFNPLDGILQASPYTFFLLFVPVHYFTHVFLLFFSGVWATNIHDSLWGDTEPIMGSKYHTAHHTLYHYNYGQFFTFCDRYWGSLRVPEKSKFD